MISEDQQPQQQTQQQREVSPWQLLRDVSVSGYEIHMGEAVYGRTENGERAIPFSILEDGREDGCVQGRVLGTYLHGIWENSEFAQKMMELLCADRGLSYEAVASEWEMTGSLEMRSYQAFKETQYDLLAEAVRKHLDMDKIYEIILKI